ncbi:MAG: oxidoreductase [Methylomonas sp.]|nr:MAG: oxidoreductase [Methylomonas sp.]PPD26979.1 MAG: oxidoreductase [Methylomonas sp.]PPD38918.1 MAG: oxidoreductase [Methylomonas sp.]PPD42598.1 MAG: oxidoreductase [Methylomonas sp.]PPD54130.1 MAG: oxidoreductase [Methylomonas sp.]
MIARIEAALRRLRTGVDRSVWLARLLHLPFSFDTEATPGLVMIQIDGLSLKQLERALAHGKMPFLKRLIRRERYRLQRLYAGVPSTTAAFQGELFYGVRQAVPGFAFMEHTTGELVRMIQPTAVASIERDLQERGGKPLLASGSAYVDNYTGGALESHFCPTAHGWGAALREAHPWTVAFLIVTNAYSFLRVIVLLALEFVLALVDCARGLIAGHDLAKELKFVPTRVIVTVLLRELATIGAKIDVARGLPIVHLNFLGYDEQAHRRGPTSLFAHWSLKGIDDAIARIWRAAHHSRRRHYDVWIYSDHGQESVKTYETLHGRPFAEAVATVFARQRSEAVDYRTSGVLGDQLNRVELLGGRWIQRWSPLRTLIGEDNAKPRLSVTAQGPVAMIYWEGELGHAERTALAQALVGQAKAPAILFKDDAHQIHVHTKTGAFRLPEDAAQVLGNDHPFLEEAAQDLASLCQHPDAGDFIALGWAVGACALSFAIERGAHGGAAAEETTAFALLPADAPFHEAADEGSLPEGAHDVVRAADLRQAAFALRRRFENHPGNALGRRHSAHLKTLRVMTYNVHSCIGTDGRISPERIARIIARHQPDVVALQELDMGRVRSGGVDQAHRIAQLLEMEFHFHPALKVEEERYGNAILTPLPLRVVKAGPLPGLKGQPWLEPRGAIWVAVEMDGVEFQIINTHLGLLPRERLVQTQALLGEDWLAHPDCRAPVILCGDFNALPRSAVCRRLRDHLNDAQTRIEHQRPRATFFGRFPTARIDHVFVDSGLEVLDVEVPNDELARLASDHLPLIVELRVEDAHGG